MFCKISVSTTSTEHLWTTASGTPSSYSLINYSIIIWFCNHVWYWKFPKQACTFNKDFNSGFSPMVKIWTAIKLLLSDIISDIERFISGPYCQRICWSNCVYITRRISVSKKPQCLSSSKLQSGIYFSFMFFKLNKWYQNVSIYYWQQAHYKL